LMLTVDNLKLKNQNSKLKDWIKIDSQIIKKVNRLMYMI
jgi:hypothetical protein